jgi:hypothetical protein
MHIVRAPETATSHALQSESAAFVRPALYLHLESSPTGNAEGRSLEVYDDPLLAGKCREMQGMQDKRS